jgi:cobalt-zinc-cadmium efflux system membrane fusion protein
MNARNCLKVCGLFAAICLSGCHREAQAPEPPAPRVDGDKVNFAADSPQLASLAIETAQPRKLAITNVTGRLYWDDDLTVRVFTPVAGRVTSIPGELGKPVSAGAPLAEIDSPDFGQAQADARTADGNLRLADKALSRAKELFDHGAAAQKDVESAEAADIAAAAERDRAQAKLALYGGGSTGVQEVYVLRSPVAGVVVDKNINPGQEVRSDQMLANAPNLFAPLFVVSNPTRLWLQLDVAESDLQALQPGQQLHVYSQAFPGRVFSGEVEVIGDSLDPATRTARVRGYVGNPDKLLKAEMYVRADVVVDPAETGRAAVEIPARSVFMRDNKHYVFVEQSPGQYLRQLVTVGAEQDGKVPIFEGVSAGQRVVTYGCLLLESLVESGERS